MQHANGSTVCDRCDADLGNGAIDKCIIVSDYNDTDATMQVFHFGRACGCSKKVLSSRNLAAYTARES